MEFTLAFREFSLTLKFSPYLEWVSSVKDSEGHNSWIPGEETTFVKDDLRKAFQHFDLGGYLSRGYMDPIFLFIHPSNSGSSEDLIRLQKELLDCLGKRAVELRPYENTRLDQDGIGIPEMPFGK